MPDGTQPAPSPGPTEHTTHPNPVNTANATDRTTWIVVGTAEERRRWFNDEHLTVDMLGTATRLRHEHGNTTLDVYRSVDRAAATRMRPGANIIDAGTAQ